MKILLFIFLPVLLFAQFGANNRVYDPNCEAITNWVARLTPTTLEVSNAAAIGGPHQGTYAIHVAADADNEGCQGNPQALSVTAGKYYRFGLWIYVVSGSHIYFNDNSGKVSAGYTDITTTGSWIHTSLNGPAVGTGTVRVTTKQGGAGTSEWYFDEVELRERLDTLWIDASQSDETNDDTTKTLTEAFHVRKPHSGGTFIATAGTYDETITMPADSSFTLWKSATAGDSVIVTAVNFSGITATLLDVYVATPTNDSNITYTYTPAVATTTKRDFGGYTKYKGFK